MSNCCIETSNQLQILLWASDLVFFLLALLVLVPFPYLNQARRGLTKYQSSFAVALAGIKCSKQVKVANLGRS